MQFRVKQKQREREKGLRLSFAFSSSGGFQGASEIVPFASSSSLAVQTIISLNSSEIYFLNTTSEANSFLSSYHISLNAKSFFSARGIGGRLGKSGNFVSAQRRFLIMLLHAFLPLALINLSELFASVGREMETLDDA